MAARCNQAISVLEGLSRQRSDHQLRQLQHTLHHEKAWMLGRAKRWDEALAAWDVAIESAEGSDREFARATRALQRANAGQYKAAAAEADELLAQPDLQPPTLFMLARAYGEAIAGARRDDRLDEGDRSRMTTGYASQAVDSLRRAAAAGYFADPMQMRQLDDDSQLVPLRSTEAFREWRASLR